MAISPVRPSDHAFINGKRTPGVVSVDVPKFVYNWESVSGNGVIGKLIYKGRELAKATLTFRLFGTQDYEDWVSLAQSLQYPDRRVETKAIPIYYIDHPLLLSVQTWRIASITVQPKYDSKGVYVASLEVVEYREPAPVAKVPDRVKPINPDPNQDLKDKIAEQNKEIAAKQAAAAKLGGG